MQNAQNTKSRVPPRSKKDNIVPLFPETTRTNIISQHDSKLVSGKVIKLQRADTKNSNVIYAQDYFIKKFE